MNKSRMSDRTPNQQDISQLNDKQKEKAGWRYPEENSGTCMECGTYITVTTYWHDEKGFASVRSGCIH